MTLAVTLLFVLFILIAWGIGHFIGGYGYHKKGFDKGYDLCSRLNETTIGTLREQKRRLEDRIRLLERGRQ